MSKWMAVRYTYWRSCRGAFAFAIMCTLGGTYWYAELFADFMSQCLPVRSTDKRTKHISITVSQFSTIKGTVKSAVIQTDELA
jgi:hypothetical protein